MAKKIDITNSINTIDDGGLNTAAEVRSLHNVELENAYGDVVTEKSDLVAGVITEKNTINTDLLYKVNIVKQGRVVTMIGDIQNSSDLIISDVNADNFFFEIINPDYFPNTTAALNKYPTYNGAYIRMGGTDRKFIYCSSIGANTTIDFSITYFTKD